MEKALLLLALPWLILAERPRVRIRDGELEGIYMETWLGRRLAAFRKVPFAAPPIGQLRFREPQPVHPWNETLDAGQMAPACPQILGQQYIGEEDCLYLNVYTPQLPSASNNLSYPVLLYIHGGAFVTFAGSFYGPRYLLDYDIVLVTNNYRLGALGFLCTEDVVSPGNNGLKDQVAAMSWIRDNIAAFGGNPDDVTLGGTSAGAASVQYHHLSRLSRGLFKRGICMSGAATFPCAFEKAPLFKTHFLARGVDCDSDDSQRLVDCLRNVSAEDIVLRQNQLEDFYITPPGLYGPVVEVAGDNRFLTQYPYQIMRTGEGFSSVMMFSVVTQEGLYPCSSFLANATGLEALNDHFLEVAPSLFDYRYTVSSKNMHNTSSAIRQFYFQDRPIDYLENQTIIKMCGDRTIVNDVEVAARIQAYAQPHPIYFYQFGYRGQFSLSQVFSGTDYNWGVCHGDDTIYIFNATYIQRPEQLPGDREMITIMSSLWANFAINGYPSFKGVDWRAINRSEAMDGLLDYVFIHSPTSIYPNRTFEFGHSAFWNNLPINEPMSGRPARDFL